MSLSPRLSPYVPICPHHVSVCLLREFNGGPELLMCSEATAQDLSCGECHRPSFVLLQKLQLVCYLYRKEFRGQTRIYKVSVDGAHSVITAQFEILVTRSVDIAVQVR